MNGIASIGKLIVFVGAMLVIFGLLILLLSKVTGGTGAPLPGDIAIRWGRVRVYLPIVTSIVLSIILTLLLWLFSRWSR